MEPGPQLQSIKIIFKVMMMMMMMMRRMMMMRMLMRMRMRMHTAMTFPATTIEAPRLRPGHRIVPKAL